MFYGRKVYHSVSTGSRRRAAVAGEEICHRPQRILLLMSLAGRPWQLLSASRTPLMPRPFHEQGCRPNCSEDPAMAHSPTLSPASTRMLLRAPEK